MVSRLTALCALGGLMCAAFTPAVAQATRLERDVEFVRKLATELRFISLAQSEVERLTQQHRSSDNFKQVFQLGIEISLIGARSHPNREERRTLFKDALERSKEFIDRYPDEAVTDKARLTMVEACYEFGRYLLDQIEIATDADPGKVKELEDLAAGVYRDGVDACDKIMATYQDSMSKPGTSGYQELFRAWYFKGILLRENARAVARDREPLCEMARDTLEEMIFEYGEGTVLGLRGFYEMAKIAEVLGDTDTAITDFKDTIDSIQSTLNDEELELPIAAQEALFTLMQEAYSSAAESLFLAGRIDDTMKLAQDFRADLREFGVEGADDFEIAHPTHGHAVFLTEARAMAESGQADLVGNALTQARLINDKHPNDIIGIKAKAVLKDILEIQTTIVDGSLLFEVAKGDYQSREYELALQNFKRAYPAMGDATKKELGLELWTTMAKCYGLQRRYLHATLAACNALELHGADGQAEPTADVLENAWQGYQRDCKRDEDPDLNALKNRVGQLLTRFGGAGSGAKLAWREARRLFADRKYVEAAAKYEQITPETDQYEPAQSGAISCYYLANAFGKARALATKYSQWLATSDAKIPDGARDKQVNRSRTVAAIAFYDAAMDFREATGEVGGTKDPTRYEPTITKFESFLSAHRADGEAFVPGTYDMMSRLNCLLGRVEKAEELYRTLRNVAPNSARVPRLATQIFDTHTSQVKSHAIEFDALVSKHAKPAELTAAKKRLDDARRAALASGIDYLRNSTSPQYAVVWNSLQIARDLKDWKTAETVGKKILGLFGEEAARADDLERFAKPILGEAYLRQENFRDAVKLLDAANVAAEAAGKPNYPVKRLLALAKGGWYYFDNNGNLVEVPGLDQPLEAYELHWKQYKKYVQHPTKGSPKYSLGRYQFYFETFSFAKRASVEDNKYTQIAATLFGIARSTDEFETLRGLGPDGMNLWNLFQAVK